MDKKSDKLKDPDSYAIEKELFLEAVDELSCRIGSRIHHDYGCLVKEWEEVVVYVLSSFLVESLNSSKMRSCWEDLYDETKEMLISLSKTINYKLGSVYPTKEEEDEFLSKIQKHTQEFKKTQEELFIHSCSLSIFNHYKYYQGNSSDDESLKEIKENLRNLSRFIKTHLID
jgi:hypothetical protein